jgi:hypothetical protein
VLYLKIQTERYVIQYDPLTVTIVCQGSLRLYGGQEYASIMELLNIVADQKPEAITLDLRELQFLNSSGINVFCRFVIRVRNHKASQLVVQGTHQISWQTKSLINFQRLMPDLRVDLEN